MPLTIVRRLHQLGQIKTFLQCWMQRAKFNNNKKERLRFWWQYLLQLRNQAGRHHRVCQRSPCLLHKPKHHHTSSRRHLWSIFPRHQLCQLREHQVWHQYLLYHLYLRKMSPIACSSWKTFRVNQPRQWQPIKQGERGALKSNLMHSANNLTSLHLVREEPSEMLSKTLPHYMNRIECSHSRKAKPPVWTLCMQFCLCTANIVEHKVQQFQKSINAPDAAQQNSCQIRSLLTTGLMK